MSAKITKKELEDDISHLNAVIDTLSKEWRKSQSLLKGYKTKLRKFKEECSTRDGDWIEMLKLLQDTNQNLQSTLDLNELSWGLLNDANTLCLSYWHERADAVEKELIEFKLLNPILYPVS